MRVLAVVFPQPGHLHPFLGIAQALKHAEHEVAFFSTEDLEPRLARGGLHAPCFRSLEGRRDATRAPLHSAVYAQRLRDPRWATRAYAHVLLTQAAAQVEPLRAVVRTVRPDVLCVDSVAYAGVIVAELQHLPWAGVSATLVALSPPGFRSVYHDAQAHLAAERDALFQRFGVSARFKVGDTISPWLNTVFATEALVPRVEADNAFSRYVGAPSPLGPRGDEPPFPWDRLDPHLPLVYASFGSQVSPPAAVLEALVQALAPDEAQVVLSVNDWVDDPLTAALPDHVIAVRYAPQTSLLDRASVMVTHGGANGVTEALLRGVPMLVIPLAHEQPLQAHLVTRAGAGRALDLAEATPARCRTELLHLMGPGPHRDHAERLRRSYAPTRAAAQISAWLAELAG